jgi:hypothetical protein
MAKERIQKLPLTELQLRDASAVLEQIPELFSDNQVQRSLAFLIGQHQKRGMFLNCDSTGKLLVSGIASGDVAAITGTPAKTLKDLATALTALLGAGTKDLTTLQAAVDALRGAGTMDLTTLQASIDYITNDKSFDLYDLGGKVDIAQSNIHSDLAAFAADISNIAAVLVDVHDGSNHSIRTTPVT